MMGIRGKEKTLREFEDMFDEVGLRLVKVLPAGRRHTFMLETMLKEG